MDSEELLYAGVLADVETFNSIVWIPRRRPASPQGLQQRFQFHCMDSRGYVQGEEGSTSESLLSIPLYGFQRQPQVAAGRRGVGFLSIPLYGFYDMSQSEVKNIYGGKFSIPLYGFARDVATATLIHDLNFQFHCMDSYSLRL